MLFEYFYGNEAEDFTFYRIPKKIITSPHFKDVSYGAKMLYGLLFDRVGLSIMNSWFDEENRAYIIFSIQEIMDMMYQNADDPNAAWDKICDIQDVRDDAMRLIRDFV